MDESYVERFSIYSLVHNQVRVSPMGEVIDLDHSAVLGDIKLYVAEDEVKEVLEFVIKCFSIEREFSK